MIYTVTFNPAIDYVVRMEKLEIGSVNRSREEALFYGGKESMFQQSLRIWA